MHIENQQIPQRELFEKLFEASYHPLLVMEIDENKLKELAEERLREVVQGIDKSLPGNELAKKLEERISKYLVIYNNQRVFASTDFIINRQGNCGVFADLIVLCLEYLGREDVLKNISVKYDDVHAWLKYTSPSSSFEINKMYKECAENYPMEILVALNWNSKGIELAKRGKHEQAIECFDRAFQLNKKDYRMVYNKGQAFFDSGQYEEAKECFNEALELNPHDSDSWYYKGKSLEKLGDVTEAKECLAEAEKWRPFYVSPCG